MKTLGYALICVAFFAGSWTTVVDPETVDPVVGANWPLLYMNGYQIGYAKKWDLPFSCI